MEIGIQTLQTLATLLPGFVTVGVVESLSHCAPTNDLNRVIRALTYAVLDYSLYALVIAVLGLGRTGHAALGLAAALPSSPGQVLLLLSVALLVGFAVCYYVRFDGNRILRWLGMTSRTCRADVFLDVFAERGASYAVFHLTDGRRLYGWPEYWPDDPKTGHFFVSQASWLVDDGEPVEVPESGLLIPREDVKWVEFVGAKESDDE